MVDGFFFLEDSDVMNIKSLRTIRYLLVVVSESGLIHDIPTVFIERFEARFTCGTAQISLEYSGIAEHQKRTHKE